MSDHHIIFFWSDKDDCWAADIPDLTHCSAHDHDETAGEALRDVMQANEAWLASARAHKQAVPKPSYRPTIYA